MKLAKSVKINKLSNKSDIFMLPSTTKQQPISVKTYSVIMEEDMTPFVLDEQEAVDEDEDHGQDDHHHYHQTTVNISDPVH